MSSSQLNRTGILLFNIRVETKMFTVCSTTPPGGCGSAVRMSSVSDRQSGSPVHFTPRLTYQSNSIPFVVGEMPIYIQASHAFYHSVLWFYIYRFLCWDEMNINLWAWALTHARLPFTIMHYGVPMWSLFNSYVYPESNIKIRGRLHHSFFDILEWCCLWEVENE